MSLATLRRSLVGASLIAAASLSFADVLLQPTWPDSTSGFIETLAGSPGAQVGMHLFVYAQIFYAIGLVGLGHLTSRRAPILGVAGAVLAGLGAFGHAALGGALVMQFALAEAAVASGDLTLAVTAIEQSQAVALLPYMAFGLFATILGCILLAIAMMRAKVAPLWVPILLLVALVAEFGLTNVFSWADVAAPALVLLAFATMGVWVLRSDVREWRTVAESVTEQGDAVEVPSTESRTA